MTKEVAEIQYLLHGAKSTDPILEGGLNAILRGFTSSHAGANIRFSDESLFNKYIKDSDLPYSITTENGQTIYTVEVNFGPTGVVGLGDTKENGILYSLSEANLSTMLLLPVEVLTKGISVLDDTNIVHSKILPFVSEKISLGITTSIHESLIPAEFRKNNSLKELRSALGEFAQNLENAEQKQINSSDNVIMSYVDRATESLRVRIAPDMSPQRFKGELSKFVTIGTPPEEVITTQLVHKESGTKGFELEAMLQFISNPNNRKPYNLVLNNCAHFLRKMYMTAANDDKLKKPFENSIFSQEKILGLIANLITPHGGLMERLDPNALCSPVSFSRMVKGANLALKPEQEPMLKHRIPTQLQHSNDTSRLLGQKHRPSILNIFASHNKGKVRPEPSSSHQQHTQELNLTNIAMEVCGSLGKKLQKNFVTEKDPEANTNVRIKQDEKVIATIAPKADHIQIVLFAQEALTAAAVAESIQEHLKLNSAERLVFNVIGADKDTQQNIVNAIKDVYATSSAKVEFMYDDVKTSPKTNKI